ncbi:MAG TPA: ABC transporter permease [Casimicrobiaceae bacterium]|nr:ABC transporter permease [Casimicrobiaceae bacterium]
MASAAPLTAMPRARASTGRRVLLLRIAIVAVALAAWEALAMSGLLFRDVVPSLQAIGRALVALLSAPDFFANLGVTAMEIAVAVAIGGVLGLAVGIALGANRFLSNAFESLLLYLGPTPKIIFFPVMLMWFGVGAGSKIAMGVVSCFFPVAISAAAGMRQIDEVLIRVGRSFRATPWKMVTSIYLPAMRQPVVNGFRLGLGVAIIGTLLAETKLSNKGLGYLVIQAYATFDMPKMYALLIVVFVLSIGLNALIGRFGRGDRRAAT